MERYITMKIKQIPVIFFVFILFSCTTLQFGEKSKGIFEEEQDKQVREFNLSYSNKVMGVPVKGEQSITEALFVHPMNKTLYIFISFPKIGILTSEDNGKTFNTSFFKLSYLEKVFQYQDKDINEVNKENEIEKPLRFFSHFAYSIKNPDKIVLSYGPYLFISNDNGRKWEVKNLFFNLENVNIRNLFIGNNDEIIVLTENRLAISKDWGRKWEKKFFKINNYPYFKLEYVTGLLDSGNNILYASIKFNDESDSSLSKNTFDYFYNNKNNDAKSGLYYSKDYGNSWIKTCINIPINLWENDNVIYGSSIYPLCFYKYDFSENFKRSSLYKYASLDNATSKIILEEYAKILLNIGSDDYQILSIKNNKILNFKNPDEEVKISDEKNFSNIYYGIKSLEEIDYIQWKNNWFKGKKSANFSYEYNFWYVFKKWTGMRTNSPVLYAKFKDTYYRINFDQKFLKAFIQYFIEKQIELNSKNPFLKKSMDVEFFDPQMDPTTGFPCNIECSNDYGENWKILEENDYLQKIIDPLSTKRSGFYWYKNVDQKKVFRMQLSFGFDKGVSLLIFPIDLGIIDNDLYLKINYFSIVKNYQDIYLVPVDKK